MKLSTICLVVLAVMATSCQCRSDKDATCITQLLPCLRYLNGTRDPPDSCCSPLRSVISDIPECLCSLITLKGAREAQRAGINIDQAQQLPARCGQHLNPIACLTGSASSGSSGESSGVGLVASSSALVAVLHLLGIVINHIV